MSYLGNQPRYIDRTVEAPSFVPGVSTTVTLGSAPGSENALDVYFDGEFQPHNTYSLSGTTITFSSPVPADVARVECIWDTNTTTTFAYGFSREVFTATEGQTLFTLSNIYLPGAHTTAVYINGLRLVIGTDYTEASPGSILLTRGATLDDEVEVVSGELLTGSTGGSTTPAQITSDQNNYSASTSASVWRLSTDASRTITGIGDPENGREIKLINVGSFDIVLANNNVSSSVENRVVTGTGIDVTLTPNQSATLWYDLASQRWRVIATNF